MIFVSPTQATAEDICIRLVPETVQDTLELGCALAQIIAAEEQYPIRAVYLHGDLGSGKTTLARGFVSALPGGDKAETASPSFTLCHIYPTRPVVLHADLYRLGKNARLPEETEEDNAILLLEWPENLASDQITHNRLEVELRFCEMSATDENLDKREQPCDENRSATVRGYGKMGHRLMRKLLPFLETRFRKHIV